MSQWSFIFHNFQKYPRNVSKIPVRSLYYTSLCVSWFQRYDSKKVMKVLGNFSLGELFVVQMMGLRDESMNPMTFGNMIHTLVSH